VGRRENASRIVAELRANIAKAARWKIPILICFSGNRGGKKDGDSIAACAETLRQVVPIAEVAGGFFALQSAPDTPGARVRAHHGLGGIQAEALNGLPAVFEHGWPVYRKALASGCGPGEAAFHLMAALMQTVEDTTAVRRRGLEGLARLRRDGADLQLLLARSGEPVPFLAALNDAYRSENLTMGGVPNATYLVEYTEDMVNWHQLGIVTANEFGAVQCADPLGITRPQRFYRIHHYTQ